MVLTNMILMWQTWFWKPWSWQTWSWQTWSRQTWSWLGLSSILHISTRGLRLTLNLVSKPKEFFFQNKRVSFERQEFYKWKPSCKCRPASIMKGMINPFLLGLGVTAKIWRGSIPPASGSYGTAYLCLIILEMTIVTFVKKKLAKNSYLLLICYLICCLNWSH